VAELCPHAQHRLLTGQSSRRSCGRSSSGTKVVTIRPSRSGWTRTSGRDKRLRQFARCRENFLGTAISACTGAEPCVCSSARRRLRERAERAATSGEELREPAPGAEACRDAGRRPRLVCGTPHRAGHAGVAKACPANARRRPRGVLLSADTSAKHGDEPAPERHEEVAGWGAWRSKGLGRKESPDPSIMTPSLISIVPTDTSATEDSPRLRRKRSLAA
jgi:hypothetical protein